MASALTPSTRCASASDRILVFGGVSAGPVRLRRQGRFITDACLVARSTPGRSFAGVRIDERRDAENGDLRHSARHLRFAGCAAMVVGRAGAGAGLDHRDLRRDVRRRAGRHETAAGLFLDREHRPAAGGYRPGHHLPRLRQGCAGGLGADRDAVPQPESRVLQEPAVHRHRLDPACDRRAQHGAHGRPDPSHAVGRGADAGRRAGHYPACRRSMVSFRNGCCCRRSCCRRVCPTVTSTC